MAPNRKMRQLTRRVNVGTEVSRILERNAEQKVTIAASVGATIASTGTMIGLSVNVAQGDNFDNRTGDKITYTHTLVKTRFTAVTTSQSARFILFSDRFNQGTTPAITDLLQTNNFIAGYNQLTVVQQKRMVIHRDWTVDCNIAGETIKSTTFTLGRTGSIYYNGTTAVAASNGRGALFLLVIGSASTGLYDLMVESKYVDM
jgi:hypothetical protein